MSWIKGSNEKSKAAYDAALWYWLQSSRAYPSYDDYDGDCYWLSREWPYQAQNYCNELLGNDNLEVFI